MSKRPPPPSNGNAKKQKTNNPPSDIDIDDLWGEDFDVDDVDRCIDQASQQCPQMSISSYSQFKLPNAVTSTQVCSKPPSVDQLQARINELQALILSKDGEVSILRNQLRQRDEQMDQSQADKRRVVDDAKLTMSETIVQLRKQVTALQAETDVKDLELNNLKHRCKVLQQAKVRGEVRVGGAKVCPGPLPEQNVQRVDSNLSVGGVEKISYRLSDVLPNTVLQKTSGYTPLMIRQVNRMNCRNVLPILQENLPDYYAESNLAWDQIYDSLSIVLRMNVDEFECRAGIDAITTIFQTTKSLVMATSKFLKQISDDRFKQEIPCENVTFKEFPTRLLFDNRPLYEGEQAIDARRCLTIVAKIFKCNRAIVSRFDAKLESKSILQMLEELSEFIQGMKCHYYFHGLISSSVELIRQYLLSGSVDLNLRGSIITTLRNLLVGDDGLQTTRFVKIMLAITADDQFLWLCCRQLDFSKNDSVYACGSCFFEYFEKHLIAHLKLRVDFHVNVKILSHFCRVLKNLTHSERLFWLITKNPCSCTTKLEYIFMKLLAVTLNQYVSLTEAIPRDEQIHQRRFQYASTFQNALLLMHSVCDLLKIFINAKHNQRYATILLCYQRLAPVLHLNEVHHDALNSLNKSRLTYENESNGDARPYHACFETIHDDD